MQRIALALLIAISACGDDERRPIIADPYCLCPGSIASRLPSEPDQPYCIRSDAGPFVRWCRGGFSCSLGAAALCTAGCVTDPNAGPGSYRRGRCIDPCDSAAYLEPPARDADTTALLTDITTWSRRCDPGPPARLVRERIVDGRVETGPSEPCPDGCEELEVPSAHRYTQERIMLRIARCKVQCPAR